MKVVNQPLRKKDAMQLVPGQPVYVDDVTPRDCLCVKLLRSPHANAIVKSINKTAAMKVPGMEAIFTWEDVDQDGRRYTQAGQTYPEASPYDRLVIDRHVRFVGDVVAILAGADEKCVDKAMKLVKVEYEVLEPVLDFHTAKDNPVLVHPEDNWESLAPVGADNRRNLCAHDECGNGDIDAVLADCDVVIDRVYHTQACQQAMMETFRTYCEIDTYGRLHIISSTQIVFHTRRIVANALHIPKSKVRVAKPRIGGGFGAKQTAVSAVYPAFVTWMTKKPSKIIFSRVESQIASSPRHEMEMHVRLGANKDGIVRGIDPKPGDALIEIGPGQAALTREVIACAGHEAAVEIDRDLAQFLREQFSPEELTLIEADALKLDWTTVLEGRRLRIIGNLPYNISSPLLFALMSAADRVIDQHFMLQREVVDRMVAEPGSKTYGRLSVMLQYRYVMHKLFDVPPGAFVPPPKVTSSIVRMVPRPVESLPEVDMDILSQVVALAFQQRRKTLRNALSTLMDDAAIKRAGVNPAARAETLDVAAFVRLAREAANLPHHADAV